MERNLDFDSVIDRKNTNSIKYDFAKSKGLPEDVLPLWVADMDFKTSSYVLDALEKQVQHGIFGYSDSRETYFAAVRGWMKERYGWEVSRQWMIKTPGIVFALAMAVRAFTSPGDGVLIQRPVYYPFGNVIESNGRKVVSNDLLYGDDHKYHIDFEDFEQKIIAEKIKLFILCNPHNPVGRVWTRDELLQMGEICQKHHVIVVSDEIHADFVFVGTHHVFADLKKEFEAFTVTCTSPSKTFNLAGLQISNIFVPNRELKTALKRQISASGYSNVNTMAIVACEAAYRDGGQWYEAMHRYVRENIAWAKQFVQKNLPGVTMAEHEGTYLIWLDFRGTGLDAASLEHKIRCEAKLWLDSGEMFGESGIGFQRINVACPRKTLEEAMERLQSCNFRKNTVYCGT